MNRALLDHGLEPEAASRAERAYWYREAVALPAGAEIELFAGEDAGVALLPEPR